MSERTLIPDGALHLGLGCSRLGSIGGASRSEALELLRVAIAEGFRVFDTSNIYGQGDSERVIGQVIAGRDDCVVISKVGKYVAWQRRALLPLKGGLRFMARRSTAARQGVLGVRSKPMPSRWSASYITSSVEASLRRLGRDHIELMMLHSPPAEVVRSGEAIGALETSRLAGKIGQIGVSVDDVDTALAALGDGRIAAIQLPLHPGSTAYDEVMVRAKIAGVAIVAREILGGVGGLGAGPSAEMVARQRITEVVRDCRIAVPLVGVSRPVTLVASASAARDALLARGPEASSDA